MSALPIDLGREIPGCEQKKIIRVSVGEDGYPRVEPDYIVINRNLGETVVWQAGEGVSFTVCFGVETPFENIHFHPCLPASGAVRKGALGREYKYSVEVNGKLIDPMVKVEPPS